jgi:ribosome-associated protein
MSESISTPESSAQVELGPGVFVPDSALRFQYSRSSGPGGQNVNKVNTKAEVWLSVEALGMLTDSARARLRKLAGRRWTAAGEIHLSADTERRQESNRQEVLARLRELLIEAMHEPKKRRKTKPSRASKRRRIEGKRHRGEIKAGRRGGGDV